ncbi:hypothetical protein [Actinomadura rugatobispora]|uniref:Uncharacterized protein n=1 Tax=Actinomadura rugatobispora TaxID=1994 RepID=A0ABW0ZV22_9ACTN|nr:hypothetical protein GCM10010200_055940 [Actinomadura rugatobispora]
MSEPVREESGALGEDGGKRRRFDPGSVVTGLFFLGVAGVFVAGGVTGELVAGPQVLGPALLVGLGLVGIVRVLTRSRRH